MADIFISFDHRDLAKADALAEALEQQGFSVWYDVAIRGGSVWRQTIATEIKKCQALIVLWTEHSKESIFVPQEVDEAISLEKHIIALRVRGFGNKDVPLGQRHLQILLDHDIDGMQASFKEAGISPTTSQANTTPQAVRITAQSVFSRAIPDITFVDRSQTEEGQRLLSALGSVGRCVRVCGPTKSGKTVLITKALAHLNPIYIPGGVTHELQTFFDHLALELDPTLTQTPSEAFIFRKAATAQRPIVIDDYHRIPTQTRKAILKRLQSFLDKDISVILVSWTDIDGDLIHSDPGLDGRSSPPIQLAFWTNAEISQIGERGFTRGLNVSLDPFTLAVMTRQSFKNPFLMQQHCEEVAKACNVDERQEQTKKISIGDQQACDIFKSLCAQTRKHFHGDIEGRRDRNILLKTGKSTTLNGLIALSIKHIEPIQAMGIPRLAINMRNLVADETWISEPVAQNAVVDFMKDLSGNPHKQTGIEFSGEKLHIHPFFKRYLVWNFAPSKGFDYPSLTA